MAFAVSHLRDVPGAKTQDDLVAADTPSTPARMEEDMNHLPGLRKIHTMNDGELIGFFKMILKSRMFINGVELCLGDYEYREEQSRIPGANNLHTSSTDDIARTFAATLASSQDIIGFKALIGKTADGNPYSKILVKIAKEPVSCPTEWEADGTPKNGDEKYSPSLNVVFSGSAYALN